MTWICLKKGLLDHFFNRLICLRHQIHGYRQPDPPKRIPFFFSDIVDEVLDNREFEAFRIILPASFATETAKSRISCRLRSVILAMSSEWRGDQPLTSPSYVKPDFVERIATWRRRSLASDVLSRGRSATNQTTRIMTEQLVHIPDIEKVPIPESSPENRFVRM